MRLALGFESCQFCCDARGFDAFSDCGDESVDLPVDLLKLARSGCTFRTTHRTRPIKLGVKLPDELLDELRRHQLPLKSVQDIRFKNASADGKATGAGPVAVCAYTPNIVASHGLETRPAATTAHQAAEEVLGSPLFPESTYSAGYRAWRGCDLFQLLLNGVPKLRIHDP